MEDIEQEVIRRYLLGELDDAGRESFEQRIMLDPEYKDFVSMVEDELIEEFVSSGLSEGERRRFAEHFLSTPQQRQRLKSIEGLQAYFARDAAQQPKPAAPRPPRVSLWRRLVGKLLPGGRLSFNVASATAALLIVLAGAGLLLGGRRLLSGSEANWGGAFRTELVRLNDPQTPPAPAPPSPHLLQVTLTTTQTRSGAEMTRVEASPETESMQVQLRLPPGQSPRYRVTLRPVDGEETFILPPLPPLPLNGNRVLLLNIPVKLLPRGDYELQVLGVDGDAAPAAPTSYHFRLAR